MNATLGMYEGQAALRMERRLAHPREKVWRALTEPDRLGQWFPFKVVEMDLRVGGKIAFDGGGMTMDAEITELDPPRLFAFLQHAPREMPREGDNILRFELLPDEGGCLLVFTQVFQDRPAAASYASGWQVCLDAMDAIVGGRPAQWPAGNFAHLHEAYVEALGLAEGTAERLDESLGDQAGGGWRVRFERQLTRPVEEVWTAGRRARRDTGRAGARRHRRGDRHRRTGTRCRASRVRGVRRAGQARALGAVAGHRARRPAGRHRDRPARPRRAAAGVAGPDRGAGAGPARLSPAGAAVTGRASRGRAAGVRCRPAVVMAEWPGSWSGGYVRG